MIPIVLCVDDDPVTQMINGFLLQDAHIAAQTLTAEDGQAALNYFASLPETGCPPTLILLDINMPILDGFGFLAAFAQQFPQHAAQTRVVVLSSSVDPEDKARAAGFSQVIGFVHKPLSRESLQAICQLDFCRALLTA